MRFRAFSRQQRRVLTWWCSAEGQSREAVICDGAVRSGKTLCMGLAFFLWATACFDGMAFGLCGKTITALRRNLLREVLPTLGALGFQWREQASQNRLTVRLGGKENTFYLFGGRDEGSAALIQGITLAGVLLDEAALMPRSFVEQACARCSVPGSRMWFSCNPEHPEHWFYKEWILKAEERRALYLHFTMEDNPALDEATRARYRSMYYAGVFYQRYILGLWVMSEGLIYDMFDQTENVYRTQERPVDLEWVSQRTVACDYGTANPTVFLDIYDHDGVIRVDREYRWDSRKERRQKTDQEYADDLLDFLGREWCAVIVDPSAASFIEELRRRGVYVIPAENEVLDGIRKTGSLFHRRKILVSEACAGLLDELGTYLWDEKAGQRGDEKPLKERDHGPDALRYYINSLPDWRFE